MTKEDVISRLKTLNLPKGSYIIFGSGPLALLGIRQVNDIDLLVSPQLYQKLQKMGWQKKYKGPRDKPITFEIFEAHNIWEFSKYCPTLDELLTRAIEMDTVVFASLEDVEKWKKASGRPKDVLDLKLIAEYRNSNP